MADSFNTKIKHFRANLRGIVDKKLLLFRIANLFAYPLSTERLAVTKIHITTILDIQTKAFN